MGSTDLPAPEWDEDFGEWGRWMPDPDVPGDEIWVAVEDTADASSSEGDASTTREQGTGVADHRKQAPIEGGNADLAWADGREPKRRCTARRTNGQPCRKAAMNGTNVCRNHGGAAPQVKAKARVRLEMAADRMARQLLGMAMNDKVPAYVKLQAITTALDRAGIGAKQAVEVEVGPAKGWEQVFAGVASTTRADARAARGITDSDGSADADDHAAHRAMMEQDRATRALAVPADDYLDAEVVPAGEPRAIDRTPASVDTTDPAQFVRAANAKAASTKPRHT